MSTPQARTASSASARERRIIWIDAIRGALSGASPEEGRRRWERAVPRAWLGWLLVALMRQLPRQRWLVEILKGRLLDADEGRGAVPGLPGWSFEFHGKGCRLSGPGEEIDIDFHGDAGLSVDPYFFAERVLGLHKPGLPERRVRELLPTAEVIAEALRELRSERILWHAQSDHVFRLPPELEALSEDAQAADFDSPEAHARWRAHLGDDDARSTAARRGWLLERLAHPESAGIVLEPLEAELSAEEFLAVCERVIDGGSVGPAVGWAVKRLDARPDLPASASVSRLVRRLTPNGDHPYSMHAAAGYLLRRGLERDLVVTRLLEFARLEKVKGYRGNPLAGEFALLALEFAHEHALELVRRGLRSAVPVARCTAAAALSGLRKNWCGRELRTALETAKSTGDAAELLAAMRARSDSSSRAFAERWLVEHPVAVRQGSGFSREELALASADAWLAMEIERLRDWLARVGPGIPENLDAPA